MYALLQATTKQPQDEILRATDSSYTKQILLVECSDYVVSLNVTDEGYIKYPECKLQIDEETGLIHVVDANGEVVATYYPRQANTYDFSNTTNLPYYITSKTNMGFVNINVPSNSTIHVWLTSQQTSAPDVSVIEYVEEFTTTPSNLSGSATYDSENDVVKLVSDSNQEGSWWVEFDTPPTLRELYVNGSFQVDSGVFSVTLTDSNGAQAEIVIDNTNNKFKVVTADTSNEANLTYSYGDFVLQIMYDGETLSCGLGGDVVESNVSLGDIKRIEVKGTTGAVVNTIELKEVVLSSVSTVAVTPIKVTQDTYYFTYTNSSDSSTNVRFKFNNPLSVKQIWVTVDQPSITYSDFRGVMLSELLESVAKSNFSPYTRIDIVFGVFISIPNFTLNDFMHFVNSITDYDVISSVLKAIGFTLPPTGVDSPYVRIPPKLCLLSQGDDFHGLAYEVIGKSSNHIVLKVNGLDVNSPLYVYLLDIPISINDYNEVACEYSFELLELPQTYVVQLPFDKPYMVTNVSPQEYCVFPTLSGFAYVFKEPINEVELDLTQEYTPPHCFYSESVTYLYTNEIYSLDTSNQVGIVVDGKPLPYIDYQLELQAVNSFVYGGGVSGVKTNSYVLIVKTAVNLSYLENILKTQKHKVVVDGVEYDGELTSYSFSTTTGVHTLRFTLWR